MKGSCPPGSTGLFGLQTRDLTPSLIDINALPLSVCMEYPHR
jgi:hypothetical protein